MLGRTYALGHEADLEKCADHAGRARRSATRRCPWAIWYPLRRAGAFEQLSAQEQRTILMEHGGIGHAYGRAGYGTDIRLACHGLDKHDNDFVVGLLGPDLYPLSSIVQRMRKTKQTSLHLERMGPFFVGKAIWQQDRGRIMNDSGPAYGLRRAGLRWTICLPICWTSAAVAPNAPALTDEITHRYAADRRSFAAAGDHARSAAAKLATAVGLPVYVGMRHWHPFIRETVAADGGGRRSSGASRSAWRRTTAA